MGYFHANERFDDFELGNVAKNIGDQISKYFPLAALLLVRISFHCNILLQLLVEFVELWNSLKL